MKKKQLPTEIKWRKQFSDERRDASWERASEFFAQPTAVLPRTMLETRRKQEQEQPK